MRVLRYRTGEAVQFGDRIVFYDEPGTVKCVLTEPTGDAGRDWYLQEYPNGGVMIEARHWGLVFLTETCDHEHLDFVGRGAA